MRIYLAHNFAAREYLKVAVIPFFENNGHEVGASWITDDRHLDPKWKVESAVRDLMDIEECGALVFFAKQFAEIPGEGKYVELGYAIRAGKIVVVVHSWHREEQRCVFYDLCTIRHTDNLEGVLPYLGGKQKVDAL